MVFLIKRVSMEDKEEIERMPHEVSRNRRAEEIKPDVNIDVNIYQYIFNLELTSLQKLFLLFLACEINYAIMLTFKKRKHSLIPKYDYLIFSNELEYKLRITSKSIKKIIHELIDLNYIREHSSDSEEYYANWYQLSGKSFKIFYEKDFYES